MQWKWSLFNNHINCDQTVNIMADDALAPYIGRPLAIMVLILQVLAFHKERFQLPVVPSWFWEIIENENSILCFLKKFSMTRVNLHPNPFILKLKCYSYEIIILAVPEVVKMTTSAAASDENFIKMTFLFQCSSSIRDLSLYSRCSVLASCWLHCYVLCWRRGIQEFI